ncbi:MAG: hypothetical protein M1828_003683 [Chrysothrix sp. TS-e1954]|nr:MAG: hypothetical protein M1828_003683 [Chrysothrix sp. TS-e1954]
MAPAVGRSASGYVEPPSCLLYHVCPSPDHLAKHGLSREQEKRYRSMQEHIRRAHPDYYVPKLPATEESFQIMINTDPSQRPRQTSDVHSFNAGSIFYDHNSTSPEQTRPSNEFRRGSFLPRASAAAALAQLHHSRPEPEWDPERVEPDAFGDGDPNPYNYFANTDTDHLFRDSQPVVEDADGSRDLLNPPLSRANSARASSLQPFPRMKIARSRKSSVTENAMRAKHERDRSKEYKRWSHDRKAFSAEPSALGAAFGGKRWEDLLDAAASATEEDSRDLTPVSPHSGSYTDCQLMMHAQIPQSPRASMPPYQNQANNHFQSYNTSPLQHAMIPQSPEQTNNTATFEPPALEAFPSVESSFDTSPPQSHPPNFAHHHQSSGDSSASNPYHFTQPPPRHHQQHSSGSNFHITGSGLSSSPHDSSIMNRTAHMHSYSAPQYQPHPHSHSGAPPLVQHYCAACHRITQLTSSYACTDCICGICRECVDVLVAMGPERGARCPRCGTVGGKFKPFMLELR